jgi:hypothetical protein
VNSTCNDRSADRYTDRLTRRVTSNPQDARVPSPTDRLCRFNLMAKLVNTNNLVEKRPGVILTYPKYLSVLFVNLNVNLSLLVS